MKKFGRPTPKQKPTKKPDPEKKSSAATDETSDKEKKKGVDETLNILADEVATNKKTAQNQKETKEREWRKEQKAIKEWEIKTKGLGTSERRKSHKHSKPPLATYPKSPSPPKTIGPKTTAGTKRTSIDTPKPTPPPQKQPTKKPITKPSSPIPSTAATNVDTSTIASQPITTFQFPSQAILIPVSKSPTKTPSPTKVYTRKRKFQVNDDDIPAPTAISSSLFIQTNPEPFIPPPSPPSNLLVDPQVLEVDDPAKRKFPSLHGFRPPKNMDEYLKLKARQAELQAKYEGKGQGDGNISSGMQHGLSKVKKLEDYARDLSKEMSNLPSNTDLQKKLRKDLLELIMRDKFYPAKVEQFKDWPLIALKDEVNRIERIRNDPQMKRSAPDWNKYKKTIAELTLEYKRKKAELVAAKYGSAKTISKWFRQYIDMVYEKLEKLRETDPIAPKKPTYKSKTTDEPKQQTFSPKTLFTSSDTSIIALNQRKRQKQIDEEDA
ncbi:muscle M-line assembly protein unc-89-like [Helianthus annuus]|uniref:muscle M-line assembly protein unc-89-like n=1 Tax=Helianthus annuus TaxID=4232 RepID=UPI000B8F93A9|nr:muscle M-line assembly protein unc-89-like [Helianthus annuus]